jgi:cold shock protein
LKVRGAWAKTLVIAPTASFGFIQHDGGGQDVFVHASAVERSGMSMIQEGQKLSFEIEKDARGGKSSAENLKAA